MALYDLASNCAYYGAMESEMIRDRLVVGIRDSALSERLQLDADLTLDKAKKQIRQREAVQEQQLVLKGVGKPDTLEAVHSHTEHRKQRSAQNQSRRKRKEDGAGRDRQRQNSKQCSRCGKGPHSRDQCPAKDATCYRCKRKGHYGALCHAKTAAAVSTESTGNLDTAFLDSASSHQETAWFADVQMGAETLTFKMDTGAEVTAIFHRAYQQLSKPPPLSTSDKALYGPSRHPLQVLGKCQMELTYTERSCKQQVYVVGGLKSNLLGLPAIISLNMAARVDVISLASLTAQLTLIAATKLEYCQTFQMTPRSG